MEKNALLDGGLAEATKELEKHVEARRDGLPSRNTSKGGDVETWLKEKAERDSNLGGNENPDLWMVHGKWYDLSEFVEKHPGGPDWLRMTKGQDITEAFEVHHLNILKAEKVLKRYYVKDADSKYVGRYFWDDNNFYRTLKRRTAEVLEVGDQPGLPAKTKPTLGFKFLCIFAILLHFATFALLMRFPSLPFAILAGLTLQAFHGIGHNALHQADNIWMYFYDFCGWKHHKHRVSHALSHHLHPNTQIDLEFPDHSFVFTSNGHLNSRWVLVVGPLAMWSGPLRDIFKLWMGLFTFQEKWRPEYLFNMFQLGLMVYATTFLHPTSLLSFFPTCPSSSPLAINTSDVSLSSLFIPLDTSSSPIFSDFLSIVTSALSGLFLFCVMHLVCGFCIETAGFGLHRSSFCWTDGDPNPKFDFAEHCLSATADHDVDLSLFSSLYLFQILNNHGIHHLFPTVDKSRIHLIMPIFRETCEEFGVPWKEYDWKDLFGSLWKVWVRGLYTDTPMISTPAHGHVPIPGSKLRILPLRTHTHGAEIIGVKVQDLTKAEFALVKKTICEHGVVILRDQSLTPDEEVAFATRFPHSRTCDLMKYCGPLAKEGFDAKEWRKFKLPGRPEIQLRGFIDLDDHYGVSGHLETGKGALEYHTDSVHEYDTPPIFTTLHCLKSPGGDDTLFIDGRAAYDRLGDAEKERVEGLFCQYKRVPSTLHESGLRADTKAGLDSLGAIYGKCEEKRRLREEEEEVQVSEVHPLVWIHPTTGRKAILSAAMWMHTIVEADGTRWTPEESHDFVYSLLAPIATPEKTYSHKWRADDLVVFDNRTVMHSASKVGPEGPGGDRLLHQIILCGDQVPCGPVGCGVGNPVVNPNCKAVR